MNHKRIIQFGNIMPTKNFKNPQSGRVYSVRGIAPTLSTCQGGGHEPKIIVVGDKKGKANI